MFYGLKTGLNEAFVISDEVKIRISTQDPGSLALMHPFLRGEDLRPWYQECSDRWVIAIPSGWTKRTFPTVASEEEAWICFSSMYSGLADHLRPFGQKAKTRSDQGDYWWELRPCDYYDAFDGIKIVWPDIAKFPRFSIDTSTSYVGNTGYILATGDTWLLGYLASRTAWFLISQMSHPFGERAGLNRYRLIDQFMRRLPIPYIPTGTRHELEWLSDELTISAKSRHALHRRAHRRIVSDFGDGTSKLNQRLTAWWELDFQTFRAELKKAFKREIPVRERDEWAGWLQEQRHDHEQLTAEIVRLETELNAQVYALFDLSNEETAIIEESTKYKYGEV